MKPTILNNLSENHKKREVEKRTEVITTIADGYLKNLLGEDILIGELERIMNYLNLKVTTRIAEHKENTYISKLNGEQIIKKLMNNVNTLRGIDITYNKDILEVINNSGMTHEDWVAIFFDEKKIEALKILKSL